MFIVKNVPMSQLIFVKHNLNICNNPHSHVTQASKGIFNKQKHAGWIYCNLEVIFKNSISPVCKEKRCMTDWKLMESLLFFFQSKAPFTVVWQKKKHFTNMDCIMEIRG